MSVPQTERAVAASHGSTRTQPSVSDWARADPIRGGAGAAGNVSTAPGVSAVSNGGGGGGGIGAIYVRTTANNFTQNGLATPAPGTGPLRTQ